VVERRELAEGGRGLQRRERLVAARLRHELQGHVAGALRGALDLEQVLAATVPTVPGLHALTIVDPSEDDGYAVTGSTVVVFGKSMEAIDRFRADPAIASSIFVTMTTDSMGFLAFLGLAVATGLVG